ncbi:putative HTH-type transcriptional regulator YusO [Streptomyces sp. YIM 121038]|uniref:MarR family winged helix-turn-helix transcriptional regulator n=1 Tax=Streptomyces sp. YIM 121038 TaxID=2136401 RepID=UPI001110898C|nr:MarR family transcriptional regulator [Streptomyces sp. YIM 121038]QCX79544.1 putative HTH-type transcriptional regulator YusO [Streptomyces sp. YIM 121038]
MANTHGNAREGGQAGRTAVASAEAAPETDEDLPTADWRVCGLVNALARRIETHVREHATALGLTAPQAVALRELTGPLTLRELAQRMSCEPSNATFVSDRLEEQGLVERRPHPSDRRAKQLVLTPRGTALRERLMASLSKESPLSALSDREQDTLHELLTRAVVR